MNWSSIQSCGKDSDALTAGGAQHHPRPPPSAYVPLPPVVPIEGSSADRAENHLPNREDTAEGVVPEAAEGVQLVKVNNGALPQ